MKWLSNFSLVMRSNLTTLREKVEDPERMLHQLIIDMEEELERVRCSVAEAVADEIQMKRRCERERSDAEKWLGRAQAAMKSNDEVKAKAALDQKMAAEERAKRYAADHSRQKSEVEKLERSVGELEERIRQAKQKKTLLMARMARAESTQKINSALERSGRQSAFSQFARLEEKVDREEAIGEAWDRLDGRDPGAEDLEFEFEQQEREERISAELQSLKEQIGAAEQ